MSNDIYRYDDRSQQAQLQDILNQVDHPEVNGIEARDEEVDVNQSLDPEDDQLEATKIEIVAPAMSAEPVKNITKQVMHNGTQYEITVRRPRRCPGCGWAPEYSVDTYAEFDGYDKPPELKGICHECREDGLIKQTCTGCRKECVLCGRGMCGACGYGHPSQDVGGPYCWSCFQHVVEAAENERAFRLMEYQFQMKAKYLEQETIREVKFRELELRDRIDRRKTRLQRDLQEQQARIEQMKAWVQHQDNIRRHELEKLRFQVETEIEERRQKLKEYKAVAGHRLEEQKLGLEAFVEKQKLDQDQQRLDLDREKMERDFDLRNKKEDNRHSEWESEFGLEEDRFEAEQDRWETEHEWERKNAREERDMDRGQFQDKMEFKRRQADIQQTQNAFRNSLQKDKHDLQMLKGTVSMMNQLDMDSTGNRRKILKNAMNSLEKLSQTSEPNIAQQPTL